MFLQLRDAAVCAYSESIPTSSAVSRVHKIKTYENRNSYTTERPIFFPAEDDDMFGCRTNIFRVTKTKINDYIIL